MDFLIQFQDQISELVKNSSGIPFIGIFFIALIAGLVASLTPCVLPMIPLYLSYIGATGIDSKIDAFKKSSLFCLGAATVFSLMGIFASFANIITVEYRGYINILVGVFIILMSLSLLEIIKLSLPQGIKNIPNGSPFIIGMAFSLISSPCASPILFSIIALSSTVGSAFKSALVMISYSVGYTFLIFLIGLFSGLAKQFDYFKKNSHKVLMVSGIILGILGMLYIYNGIMWFIS